MRYKYNVHGRQYREADRNHPKYNLARNSFFHGDFSADHSSLTADDRAMADFAQIPYRRDRPHEYLNHTYDRHLSDAKHAVYVHNSKKKLIFANRGTHQIQDIPADIHVFQGTIENSLRIKESTRKMHETMKKYPEHNITTTSHSLGASIQMHMLETHPHIAKRVTKQYLYNPGASSYDFNLNNYAKNPKNHFYIKHGDPASIQMLTHTKPKNMKLLCRNISINPKQNHAISNFQTHMNKIPTPSDSNTVKYDPDAEYLEQHHNPHELVVQHIAGRGPINK